MANNVVIRIFTGHVWNKILTYCLVHTTQCRLFLVLVVVVWNNAVPNIPIITLSGITLKNAQNNIYIIYINIFNYCNLNNVCYVNHQPSNILIDNSYIGSLGLRETRSVARINKGFDWSTGR